MQYTLKRYRRSRSVRIRVDHSGEVIVSAPIITPKKIVDVIVKKNGAWIKRQKEKLSYSLLANPVVDWDNSMIRYLGRLYPVRSRDDQKELVKIEGWVIWVNPPSNTKMVLKKTVMNWIKQKARKEINDRVRKWSEKMSISYKSVRIAQQKSRWGSCSNSGTLSFNWRLIHFPDDVIDYVVIHELAHILHHNHSKSFWRAVERYDKNYQESVAYLKKQRVKVEEI